MAILKKMQCSKCKKQLGIPSQKKADQMHGLPHQGCGGKWKKMDMDGDND